MLAHRIFYFSIAPFASTTIETDAMHTKRTRWIDGKKRLKFYVNCSIAHMRHPAEATATQKTQKTRRSHCHRLASAANAKYRRVFRARSVERSEISEMHTCMHKWARCSLKEKCEEDAKNFFDHKMVLREVKANRHTTHAATTQWTQFSNSCFCHRGSGASIWTRWTQHLSI